MKRVMGFIFTLCALAAAPPAPDPPPPRRAPPPPQPSVWQQIQPSLDRSTGRIVDDTTFELNRLNYLRDRRLGLVPPLRDFERLQIERDRHLRIEERNQRLRLDTPRARREELDRREYELMLHSGLYAAGADEQALSAAKSSRDRLLIEADNRRIERVRAEPDNRAQIEADYLQQTREIRERYDAERARIFGMPSGPATHPATVPAP